MGHHEIDFSNYVVAHDDRSVAEELLRSVHEQLKADDDAKRGRSYLGTALSYLDPFAGSAHSKLEKYRDELETDVKREDYGAAAKLQAEVSKSIASDQKHGAVQDGISFYGGTALKVGALFYGGRVGWGATAGLYAADAANPYDSFGKQAVDLGLGATKGVAYKALVNGVMDSHLSLPVKGLAMSLGGRGLDTLLTSDSYFDRNSGRYNFTTGLMNTGSELTNVKHLAVDAAVMGVGFGLGYGVNRFLGPMVSESPLWSRIASSGMAGASRGAIGEISAMEAAGEQFSFSRVMKKSALMGTVYALAAVPGAIQADHQYQAQHHQNDAQHHSQDNTDDKSQATTGDGTDQIAFRQFKKLGTVQAEQLKAPTTWTTSKGETMQAEAGDFKVTGPDGSTWSVKPDIFQQTYSQVEGTPGTFAKTAITNAYQLTQPTTIQTLEGQGSGNPGDYLVRGPKGEEYIVPKAKFESMYVPTNKG
jgi:hypothetical protein